MSANRLTWHRRAPQPADERVLIRANGPPWMCLLVWDDSYTFSYAITGAWIVFGPGQPEHILAAYSQADVDEMSEQFGFEMARV